MTKAVSVSRARQELSEVFSAAVRHHIPVLVERREERAVLVGIAELDALLAAYEFHPQAFIEAKAVTLWLPEFSLYGRGGTWDDAQKDLLEEVRAYVSDYLDDIGVYLNAPNRARHFPHVVRAFINDAQGRLGDVVFAPPSDDAQRAGAEGRAAAAV